MQAVSSPKPPFQNPPLLMQAVGLVYPPKCVVAILVERSSLKTLIKKSERSNMANLINDDVYFKSDDLEK